MNDTKNSLQNPTCCKEVRHQKGHFGRSSTHHPFLSQKVQFFQSPGNSLHTEEIMLSCSTPPLTSQIPTIASFFSISRRRPQPRPRNHPPHLRLSQIPTTPNHQHRWSLTPAPHVLETRGSDINSTRRSILSAQACHLVTREKIGARWGLYDMSSLLPKAVMCSE